MGQEQLLLEDDRARSCGQSIPGTDVRVLAEDGSPIARASVMLNLLVQTRHDSSKEDGSFRIELAPGRYDLHVNPFGSSKEQVLVHANEILPCHAS